MTLMEWAIDVPQELLQSDAIPTISGFLSYGIEKEELNIKESYKRIVVCNSAT